MNKKQNLIDEIIRTGMDYSASVASFRENGIVLQQYCDLIKDDDVINKRVIATVVFLIASFARNIAHKSPEAIMEGKQYLDLISELFSQPKASQCGSGEKESLIQQIMEIGYTCYPNEKQIKQLLSIATKYNEMVRNDMEFDKNVVSGLLHPYILFIKDFIDTPNVVPESFYDDFMMLEDILSCALPV